MRKPRVNRSERREEISGLLRRLAFSQTTLRLCAEEGSAAQEEFLLRVLESEAANREEVRKGPGISGRRASRSTRRSRATNTRTSGCRRRSPGPIWPLAPSSRTRRTWSSTGPVGTGKTHLATALGVVACERSIRTRFFTVAQLVVRLSEAYAGGTLEKTLVSILKAELLILDEWGYVPIDKHGAQLLFRIISDSYERRSLIITTNTEFSKWGSIFTDDQMAAAMIDRLAHHGHILLFEGESYRMKHALMRQRH